VRRPTSIFRPSAAITSSPSSPWYGGSFARRSNARTRLRNSWMENGFVM
jgi:hypothetical protein